MRLCFVSGAPWNATDGAQRYQQLVIALRKLGVESYFHCPYEPKGQSESPFDAPEDLEYDFFIVGMPERRVWDRRWRYKTLVFDICDRWDGPMVEGVDFTDEFIRLVKAADFIVAVTTVLAIRAQEIAPSKPTFIVPNGVREEAFNYTPKIAEKPRVFFWASAHIGQEWWDLEALFELPRFFPDIEFRYYFAANRQFTASSPNLIVRTAERGIPFKLILNELTLPSVGIAPWKANNTVSWSADALKLYEYAVLGMTIVATNCYVPSEIRDAFLAFGDTKKLLPKLVEQALKEVSLKTSNRDFSHWSWKVRAKQFLDVLEFWRCLN